MSEWIIISVIVVSFFAVLSMSAAGLSLAPWVPTKKKDLERVLEACRINPSETFMEIGCGNGRVSLFVHDRTRARVIGIERAWPLAAVCFMRKWLGKKSRFEVRWQDALKADLSQADVVFTFGMPTKLKEKLAQTISQLCKPGTRVVSYVFPIEPWKPDAIYKPTPDDLPIYTYTLS